MFDSYSPLDEDELILLDEHLINRIDKHAINSNKDVGIIDLSTLDGFFTAIVSSPITLTPALWLPAVWGDFKPKWKHKEEFSQVIILMLRHMNGIAENLIELPNEFEPLFLEHDIDGAPHIIVDNWCEGYRRGVELSSTQWLNGGTEMAELLAPIYAFTALSGWPGYHYPEQEIETIQHAIVSNVRDIYQYWLARRPKLVMSEESWSAITAKANREDSCPCGSGKKYKKCCLH
jgi:uncharacterized protein